MQLNGPQLISITWLAPRVETNKQTFVVVYTGFTISISYFQVFFIFFVLSFLYIFRFFSSFSIFRVYFSSILRSFLFFLNSHFFLPIFLYIFSFLYLSYFLYSQVFCILFTFMLFIYFIFWISPTSSYRKCFIYQSVLWSWQICFLIPVILKDWWFLWWDIHQNGWIFYDLIYWKQQFILCIQIIIESQYKV